MISVFIEVWEIQITWILHLYDEDAYNTMKTVAQPQHYGELLHALFQRDIKSKSFKLIFQINILPNFILP